MKTLLLPLLCLLSLATVQAETKSFVIDAEGWPEGAPPKEVFVVEGNFSVVSKDGNKTLQIGLGELVEANALLGVSSSGSSSIEARVFGTKMGRSAPRFAIGVHGQSGYRLSVFATQKQLQLTKGDEVITTIPYVWPSDSWVRLKLEVKKVEESRWTITGKVWADGTDEPKEPSLSHEDTTLKGQGKCSIWGTTFSNTPILFDDIKIEVEQAEAK